MKITQIYFEDKSEYHDKGDAVKILFDDERKFSIRDVTDCPEDATLSRDLSDALNIFDMLKEVYELGKQGKEIIFEEITKEQE